MVGQFAGAHGVRGEFKVRSFTAVAADVATYGPVATDDGRTLTLRVVREAKPGLLICRAPEIPSRDAAEGFAAALLHVARSAMPEPEDEDEFYLDDLVGLAAVTGDGSAAGTVRAVQNFGAGDLLELTGVPGHRGTILLPFTREAVPRIDIAAGAVTVVLPEPEADPVDDGAPPA